MMVIVERARTVVMMATAERRVEMKRTVEMVRGVSRMEVTIDKIWMLTEHMVVLLALVLHDWLSVR